jgi:tetratricopeptide (TPR) repeat protein
MQPNSWDDEYNLGTALLSKGEVDEAIMHCEKAVTIQPNDPDAQVALGGALLEKKRIDEAIMHYQKALAIRPDYFLARCGLGRALLEKGELDDAIRQFRAALLIQSEHPDCHTVLAVALDEKGETAEAIQHYDKALEISPKSIPALTNLAWVIATCSNGSLRNGARAVEIARRANELSGGSNPIVLRALAAAYAEAGQFEKAIETAGAAIQLSRLSGDHSLSWAIEGQLRLYQLGIPYREPAKLKEP